MWLLIVLGALSVLFLGLLALLIKLKSVAKQLIEERNLRVQLLDKINIHDNELSSLSQQISNMQKMMSQQQGHSAQQEQSVSQLHELAKLLQQQALELQNQVQTLESQQEENKLYTRAKKLIELGADVDELILECGLSRSEAELLVSIHRSSN